MAKGFNSRGFGGMGGMGGGMNMNMVKQVQKMQAELAQKTYTAAAGGGVVTARVNGQHQLLEVTIDPEAVDPDDVEMLQDMVVAAVNEAMRTAEADMAASMQAITGGLGL